MRFRQITALVAALVASSLSIAANADDTKGINFEPKDLSLSATQREAIAQNNIGFSYWIELLRNGKTQHVTNRLQFKSGDRIRFHVKPVTDGYAYILLKSGSRGEKAVLFPDEKVAQNNQLQHGKDYALPAEGYLKFDQNPGKEKVTLLLSRNEIDADAYLSKPVEQPTVIASALFGSKDIAGKNVFISSNPEGAKEIKSYSVFIASTPPNKAFEPAHTEGSKIAHIESKVAHIEPSKPVHTESKPAHVAKPAKIASAPPVSRHKEESAVESSKALIDLKPIHIASAPKAHKVKHSQVAKAKTEDNEITVLKKSSGVLYVSVDLDHHS